MKDHVRTRRNDGAAHGRRIGQVAPDRMPTGLPSLAVQIHVETDNRRGAFRLQAGNEVPAGESTGTGDENPSISHGRSFAPYLLWPKAIITVAWECFPKTPNAHRRPFGQRPCSP
jgi:hypothetical protein